VQLPLEAFLGQEGQEMPLPLPAPHPSGSGLPTLPKGPPSLQLSTLPLDTLGCGLYLPVPICFPHILLLVIVPVLLLVVIGI